MLPNLPHASVPVGKSAADNVGSATRRASRARSTSSRRPHWDLGPALGILDFERAARIAGARVSRC